MLTKDTKLRFWCQKVLPLVYDDSLSYYELLNKVVLHLNTHTEDINELIDFVNNFSDDIEQVLIDMAESGELDEPILNALAGVIAREYDPDKHYIIFEYCFYDGNLYRANSSTTGVFDPTKWDEKILADDLSTLESRVYSLSAENVRFDETETYTNGTVGEAILNLIQGGGVAVTNVFYNAVAHAIQKTINNQSTNVIDVENDPTNSENKLPSSKAVYNIKNMVEVSNSNAHSDGNKLWINESTGSEVQVPLWSEFQALESHVSGMTYDLELGSIAKGQNIPESAVLDQTACYKVGNVAVVCARVHTMDFVATDQNAEVCFRLPAGFWPPALVRTASAYVHNATANMFMPAIATINSNNGYVTFALGTTAHYDQIAFSATFPLREEY